MGLLLVIWLYILFLHLTPAVGWLNECDLLDSDTSLRLYNPTGIVKIGHYFA